MTEYLNVGKIVNTHGVQGELRVLSVTDFAEERFQVGNELAMFKPGETKPTKVKILTHRQHKNFDLITLENVYNLKLAEELKNSELKIEKDRVQALPEGEYYYHEILGCVVFAEDGSKIGEVKEVLATGANDVWVVKDAKGKDQLIPFIPSIVLEVNVSEKRIVIEVIEGLLS